MSAQGSVLHRASAIAEAPADLRPRERLLTGGAQALSDAELLAVVLRNGRPGRSALELASDLLIEAGGVRGLAGACYDRLRRPGVGRAKVAAVLAATELACRMAAAEVPERRLLSHPDKVARWLDLRYGHLGQEVIGAFFCNVRHRLLAERELFRGTLNRAAVEPREVLREGLVRGTAAVLLYPIHPSGDPSPSRDDLLFTRRMSRAGEVVGVQLVDHLIVASGGRWVSLREQGGW